MKATVIAWSAAMVALAALAAVLAAVFGADSRAWRWVAALDLLCLSTGLWCAAVVCIGRRIERAVAEFKETARRIRDGEVR
jgi:hypothetical protein